MPYVSGLIPSDSIPELRILGLCEMAIYTKPLFFASLMTLVMKGLLLFFSLYMEPVQLLTACWFLIVNFNIMTQIKSLYSHGRCEV